MPFVLDASIAAYWALADEQHADADLAFRRIRTDEAVVPALWWFEVRNVLVVNERRGRITLPETAAFLRHLAMFSVLVDRLPDGESVMRIARAHQLSVYDAAYLELAQREGLAIATLNAQLRKAASTERVALIS
jgi:predicted nucleic acid-binding protein